MLAALIAARVWRRSGSGLLSVRAVRADTSVEPSVLEGSLCFKARAHTWALSIHEAEEAETIGRVYNEERVCKTWIVNEM